MVRAEPEEYVIFDGEDVRVCVSRFDGSSKLVITFTGRSSRPPAEKGFGYAYFTKRRVSAIYFISKSNHWWQTKEMSDAISVINNHNLLNGYQQISLYGSSMGGYASLMYSSDLNASNVIVVSPQYSINHSVVPFERRWRDYARNLKFDYDDMPKGLSPSAQLFMVVDPYFRPDMRHVRLIEELRPVTQIAVSFAGHNTARCLEEAGLMQGALEKLLDGSFNQAEFDEAYSQRRYTSSLFWFGLAEALIQRRREAWAGGPAAVAADMLLKGARMRDASLHNEILRLAILTAVERNDKELAASWLATLRTAAPDSAHTKLSEARVAGILESPDVALQAAQRAREVLLRDDEAVALLIDAMDRAGQEERALRFAIQAAQAQPRKPHIQLALAQIQAKLGRSDEALATLQSSQKRGSSLAMNRILMAHLLNKRGRSEAAQRQLTPVLQRAIASTCSRSKACELGLQLGMKAEVQRFLRRNEHADVLYRHILECCSLIDPKAPNASMLAVVGAMRSGWAQRRCH